MYPWQPGNYVDLDSIYVPVTIDITIPGMRPIKERLKSYQEIFESEEDARYLLTGSPGQGKSTFCSKLAFDWCHKSILSPLKDTQLLFIIQLATLKHSSNIEDAICSQLLSSNVDRSTLGKVVQTLGKDIVIVLDGLDEAPPDLFKYKITGNLVDIIRFKQYRECCVLVTTRPWREKEIISEIPVYRRLELQTMKRSDIRVYVKKLFGQNPTDLTTIALGKRLLQYIDENKLLLDITTPLMVLLISWYWVATNGKKGIPDRITEFYDDIVTIMYDNFMKSTSDESTQSAQKLEPSLVDRIRTSVLDCYQQH
ncbi:baculoviral IAP repeat-containing protein 1e-like [Amphiura filiformis]|uniref:baculoviral IAP repeat-containing protein 1e-like n=1 Tax=Amphiura filiformis TaxID=82378 RepID=UPI003B223672